MLSGGLRANSAAAPAASSGMLDACELPTAPSATAAPATMLTLLEEYMLGPGSVAGYSASSFSSAMGSMDSPSASMSKGQPVAAAAGYSGLRVGERLPNWFAVGNVRGGIKVRYGALHGGQACMHAL